jgi:DNA-directed RNA polymerase specialized sigma24 family protein
MEVMTRIVERDLTGVIVSAAGGDDLAFGRIVAVYHGEMVRVCTVVVRDRAIAEDAVQAAWSIAWRRLGTVRDPDRLRQWLVSVAVNEARQILRRRYRRALIEIAGDDPEPSGGVDPASAPRHRPRGPRGHRGVSSVRQPSAAVSQPRTTVASRPARTDPTRPASSCGRSVRGSAA